MLAIPNKQQLVLKQDEVPDLCSIIPHARRFTYKGNRMFAVPHQMDECLVLRNLGVNDVPPPILSYYKWPGRFAPMEHQKKTAGFLTLNRRALVLSDPGTGKTAANLWAADYLMRLGLVNKAIIVAPLSILKTVWGKEIMTVVPHRRFNLLTGAAKRRRELIRQRVDFHIVNHDGWNIIKEHLEDTDLVIYDEATALKSPSTLRFRGFYSWVEANSPWLWMNTGTPIAQSPVDAWALAKLVKNPHVRRTYTGFRDQVMNKVGMFRWIPRPEALSVCKQVLQPSIRYSLEQCVELPPMIYETRSVEMTEQQTKAFKEMREQAYVAAHDISAANAAVVVGKLIQICCGAIYGNKKEIVYLDATPRLEALVELIEELGGRKMIIFVPLRSVQNWLYDRLKQNYTVASVHGDVKAGRSKIFDAFQNKADPQLLLAHPQVTAHGLTLTAANTIVWFAPYHSLERYVHANARIRRKGTVGKTRVIHLAATPFERTLYTRLATKRRVLENFLELVEE